MAAAAGVGVAWLLRRRRFSETCANLTGEGKGEEEMREREREASKPEVLALKHERKTVLTFNSSRQCLSIILSCFRARTSASKLPLFSTLLVCEMRNAAAAPRRRKRPGS